MKSTTTTTYSLKHPAINRWTGQLPFTLEKDSGNGNCNNKMFGRSYKSVPHLTCTSSTTAVVVEADSLIESNKYICVPPNEIHLLDRVARERETMIIIFEVNAV